MARIRTIKPEFFDDEDLCILPFPHRLAYIGLWTQADKAGRMEDRPKRLKARIFPYDDVDMDAVLMDLARTGFVLRYLVRGKAYLAIKPASWAKHQRVRPDEPESEIPSADDASAVYASLGEDDRDDSDETDLRRTVPVPPQMLGKERKGSGKEGEGNGESAEPPSDSPPSSPELRVRADGGPVILAFPVVGTGGPEWRLRRRQVEEWSRLFPGLDVLAECRHALAWVIANPGRRKTAKGMPKFLVGWMTRTVDRRGTGAQSSAQSERREIPDWPCRHEPPCGSPQWHLVVLARERGEAV